MHEYSRGVEVWHGAALASQTLTRSTGESLLRMVDDSGVERGAAFTFGVLVGIKEAAQKLNKRGNNLKHALENPVGSSSISIFFLGAMHYLTHSI